MQESENMASEETKSIARLRNDSVAAEAAGYTILAKKFTETADVIARLQDKLAAMTAERDALVGAAYVEMAKFAEVSAKGGCDPKKLPNIIRALTPADAITALDHIRAQAKAEGMREAAAMLNEDVMIREADASRFRQGSDPHYYRMDRARVVKDHAEAILAAAEKEAGK